MAIENPRTQGDPGTSESLRAERIVTVFFGIFFAFTARHIYSAERGLDILQGLPLIPALILLCIGIFPATI